MQWVADSPQKLIAFLQRVNSKDLSGKSLRRALASNFCRVNGKIERFASAQVRRGDRIELFALNQSSLKAPSFTFKTLYENEEFLLVDKPSGWICDPSRCAQTFGSNHFLVHRLDKDTTGVLAIAKSQKVKDEFIGLFTQKEVQKTYLALADGIFRDKKGVKSTLLSKKRVYEGQTIWGSSSIGKEAITHWEVLREGNLASLVLCRPLTGRTHQIRVHLAELGHPILIDRQYASRYRSAFSPSRTLLHACQLQFQWRGKEICARAPMPQDMQEACHFLDLDDFDSYC